MRLWGIIIEILLVILAVAASIWFTPRRLSLTPLPPLSAPGEYQLAFSGPLDLRKLNTQVLGATAEVDPLEIIRLVNQKRQARGTAILRVSDKLMQTAQKRAETIVRHHYFSHYDPDEGIELATILPKLGYYYQYAAENIGMGEVSAEGFVNGFFNSPAHRDTLLNPKLIESGVGVARGNFNGWETLVVVEHFAIPGTKRDWYGWDESEISYYQQLLGSIRANLRNTQIWLAETGGENSYYMVWQELLKRQEEIIATLLLRMQTGEPFTKEERDLIHEYNSNWERAPKS